MNNETKQNELLNSNFIQANSNGNNNLEGTTSSSLLTQSPPAYPSHFSIEQEQNRYGVSMYQNNATSNNIYQNQQTIPVVRDEQNMQQGYGQTVPLQQQENNVQQVNNDIRQNVQPMHFVPPVQNGTSLEEQQTVQNEQPTVFTKPVGSFTEMPFAGVNQQEEKEEKMTILPNAASSIELQNKTLEDSNMQPVEKKTDANAGLKFLFVIFIVLLIVILCLPLIGLN